jgi:hypothetical protein
VDNGGMPMVRVKPDVYAVVLARAAAEQRTIQVVVERALMAGLGVEARPAATAQPARGSKPFHPVPKAKSLR